MGFGGPCCAVQGWTRGSRMRGVAEGATQPYCPQGPALRRLGQVAWAI